MRPSLIAIGIAALALALPANAATYTYEINYNFPILRDAQLGSFAKPRAGRGSLSGTIILDDSFATTRQLVAFNLTTMNTTTGFTQQNAYGYSSDDANDTASYAGPTNTFDPYQSLTFANPDSAVACSEGNIAPSGQHQGRAYCVLGSSLKLSIARGFNAGDAGFTMIANETFGIAPLRDNKGFADLGFEHTASRNGAVAAGTLIATNNDTDGDLAPVPLPAGLPMLLAGLAAFGLLRRETS